MIVFWVVFAVVAVLVLATYLRMRREYRRLGRWGKR